MFDVWEVRLRHDLQYIRIRKLFQSIILKWNLCRPNNRRPLLLRLILILRENCLSTVVSVDWQPLGIYVSNIFSNRQRTRNFIIEAALYLHGPDVSQDTRWGIVHLNVTSFSAVDKPNTLQDNSLIRFPKEHLQPLYCGFIHLTFEKCSCLPVYYWILSDTSEFIYDLSDYSLTFDLGWY